MGNELGEPIDIKNAHEHVFGAVLLNDWSARDIQQFEYVPLGPFLGKNFGTTISGWIVTMEALEPFRCPSIVQDPVPCEYLRGGPNDAYDVQLAVEWHVGGEKQRVATSNLKYLYWSIYQQLSHHTVNGCNMRTGDLLGTGTISGPGAGESGSFLELTMNGANSVQVGSHTRTWVENGDAISLIAQCQNSGVRLGFGECIGSIRK